MRDGHWDILFGRSWMFFSEVGLESSVLLRKRELWCSILLPFSLFKTKSCIFLLPTTCLNFFSSLEDKGSEIPVIFHSLFSLSRRKWRESSHVSSAFHCTFPLRKIKNLFIYTMFIWHRWKWKHLWSKDQNWPQWWVKWRSWRFQSWYWAKRNPLLFLAGRVVLQCNFPTFNLNSQTSKPFFIL